MHNAKETTEFKIPTPLKKYGAKEQFAQDDNVLQPLSKRWSIICELSCRQIFVLCNNSQSNNIYCIKCLDVRTISMHRETIKIFTNFFRLPCFTRRCCDNTQRKWHAVNIHYDAEYLNEPKAQLTAGVHFFKQWETPPNTGAILNIAQILHR